MPKPWEKYQSQGETNTSASGPWAKYQNAPETMDPMTSALYGAGQGLTFGFADEGLAGLKAAKQKLTEGGDFGDLYKKKVAEERENLAKAQSDNPKSYLGGTVAGAIPTLFIPGAGEVGLGGQLVRAAGQGALMGAGTSNANPLSSPDKAKEFAGDVVKGGVVGGALQGAFSGVGNVVSKFAPEALQNFAEQRAVKAVTGNNAKQLRNIAGTTTTGGDLEIANQNISKMGRSLLDKGLVKPGQSIEEMAPGLYQAKEKAGQDIGSFLQSLDKQTGGQSVNPQNISQKILDYAATVPENTGGKALQNRLLQEAQDMQGMGGMSFEAAQKLKNQYKYNPVNQDQLISSQDATNKLRSLINQETNNAASQISPEAGAKYQQLKSEYGPLKSAADASSAYAERNLKNKFLSPSDYGVGATMGAIGGMAHGFSPIAAGGAALGAFANKWARERGNSTAAVVADNLSKLLDKSPEFAKQFGSTVLEAADKGPQALALTHYLLMKNPNYSKIVKDSASNLLPSDPNQPKDYQLGQ